MKIIIDNRENGLINEIKQKKPKLQPIVEIKSLPIGDVLILNKESEIILIIERKTWSDLNKSIMDGRYRNQKERLKSFTSNENLRRDQVMYLIEGEYTNNYKGLLQHSTLKTACVNLQIRDGFRVYNTESIKDTVEFLQKIINCLNKYSYYSTENNQECDKNEFYKSMNIVKKNNMTPQIAYLNQLSIIPGLSAKKSQCIIELFPNWIELIDALRESNKGDVLKKCKGIGSKLSEKIYEYIINN